VAQPCCRWQAASWTEGQTQKGHCCLLSSGEPDAERRELSRLRRARKKEEDGEEEKEEEESDVEDDGIRWFYRRFFIVVYKALTPPTLLYSLILSKKWNTRFTRLVFKLCIVFLYHQHRPNASLDSSVLWYFLWYEGRSLFHLQLFLVWFKWNNCSSTNWKTL
jgi:hypothetical protein